MNKRKVVVIDYDVGNIGSIRGIIRSHGYPCSVSSSPQQIADSDVIVLPGVGAFPKAMAKLEQLYLVDLIREMAEKGKIIIGVCLGMQLLFDKSEEICETKGLGVIPGEVKKLGKPLWHIGWNSVHRISEFGVGQYFHGQQFYFNHSFSVRCDPEFRKAVATLENDVVAVVQKGNTVGLQFHPEKSQQSGYDLIGKMLGDNSYA
jgi:glutamine amidotransferase